MKLDKRGVVQRRIDLMAREGIDFRTRTEVGRNYPVERLRQDFDAIVLCTGATQPRNLPVPGRELKGIHFAMEYLTANTRALLLADGLFHVVNGRVEVFSQKDGLPGNHCVPVHLDDSGAFWIVAGGNLSRRIGERFQNVSEEDGLPKDVLLDLIEDDFGNFWISGKRGIHRILRQELEDFFAGRVNRVRALTLGARDGLLTPECSSLHYPTMAKTPDGHIWVATRNGLATFDPRQVQLDTQPLTTIIEQIVVNRRQFPFARSVGTLTPAAKERESKVRLPPCSGRQIEFYYSATSLVAADRVRFRHRLDGYDLDWSSETDLRLAFYTNLRPGAYRFRVKAAGLHKAGIRVPVFLPVPR